MEFAMTTWLTQKHFDMSSQIVELHLGRASNLKQKRDIKNITKSLKI